MHIQACPQCNAQKPALYEDETGRRLHCPRCHQAVAVLCRRCSGAGKLNGEDCWLCAGQGWIEFTGLFQR